MNPNNSESRKSGQTMSNSSIVIAVFLSAMILCGCEDPPTLPLRQITNSLPENVLAAEGRGGYDWQRDGRPFVYQRKLSLEFFERVNTKNLFEALNQKPVAVTLTEAETAGLESDVIHNLNRYLNRTPTIQLKHEIPVNENTLATGHHFDAKGERLITAGKRIQIWDVESGTLLSSISIVQACRSVYFMKESDQCLATFEKSIAIHRISTQEEMFNRDFDDPIVFSTYSFAADLIAVVTQSKRGLQLHVLNAHTRPICKTQPGEILDPQVGIHSSGKYIVVRGQQAGRWMIENQPEFAWIDSKEVDNTIGLAGLESDYWIGVKGSLQFAYPGPNPSSFVHMISNIVDAKVVNVENKVAWVLVLGKKIGPDGKWQSFLQDIDFNRGEESIPEIIEHEVLSLDVAHEGKLVSIGTPNAIIVANRARFSDPYFTMTSNRFAALIQKERYEELDKVIKLVRELPLIYNNDSGELLYGKLLGRIGSRWADTVRNSGSFGIVRNTSGIQFQSTSGTENTELSKFEKWLATGSSAAQDAYAVAMFDLQFQDRYSLARSEAVRVVNQLINQPQPSALAFELKVRLEKFAPSLSAEKMDSLLERATSMHPRSFLHHIAIAGLADASDFITVAEDANTYLNLAADLYGEQYGDAVYAVMFARYIDQVAIANLPMNRARMLRGIRRATELDWLPPSDCYTLFGRLGINFRDSKEGIELIPNHFLRTRTFCYAFSNDSHNKYFVQARDQAFSQMK